MKMTKRWLSVLLCVIMAVTVFTVTASAAGGATNVAFAVEKTEVNVGDTFTVTLSNKAMTVTGFSAGFAFDKELLECVSIAGPNPGMPTMYYLSMNYSGMAFPVVATAVSTVDEANANGTVGFAYIGTADTAYLEGVLFTVTFRAKAAGTASFTLYEESNGTDAFKSDSIETKTVTIKEAAPACEHEYNYDCDTVCKKCGETTRPDATHAGGEATCTKKAVCTACKQEYGDVNPTHHKASEWYNSVWKYDGVDTHSRTITCGSCGEIARTETQNCYDGSDRGHDCDVCPSSTPRSECHGGKATCLAPALCSECSTYYGDKNPSNHASDEVTYKNVTATAHDEYHMCCDTLKEENVTHTYKGDEHKCDCGAVEKFTLTFVVEGNTFWTVTGQYNTFVDYTNMPATDDRFGYTFAWDTTLPETFNEHATITGEYTAMNGWTQVSNAWYYFTNGVPAKGLTRVPYPTAPINGVTYAPNDEDVAYYNAHKDTSKYSDATTAVFYFDANGKFVQYNGVEGKSYFINGMAPWHVGMVKIGNDYYYFAGDKVNGGNVMATGKVYTTRANETGKANGVYNFDVDGKLIGNYFGMFEEGGKIYYRKSNGELAKGKYYVTNLNGYDFGTTKLYFDEITGEMLTIKNGIVKEGEKLYYYKNNHIQYGAGVVELEDEQGNTYYIYVRSNGELATGKYWPTTGVITEENPDGLLPRGEYDWGEDGKYYPAE